MSNDPSASASTRPGWVGGAATLAAVAGVLVAAVLFIPGLKSFVLASEEDSETAGLLDATLITADVKRATFESVLNAQGNLESQSNATLTSQVEGSTTIISIVPEGSWVEEGQIVCELDSSELVEQVKQQEINVTQANAKLAQAKEELLIQERQNESDIAAAELAFKLAELDLEKYDKGEYPASQKEMAGIVALADEEYLRSQDRFQYTKDMVAKGFKTPSDLEADRIAVKGKRLELDKAREDLKVLTEYTRKRQIAELEANAVEFKRELERTSLRAKSAYAQAKAEVDSANLTLEVEEEKLERYRKQLAACVLKAPQAGEVVYASEQSSRGRSEGAAIEEGASVRQRQAIINLPDVSKMKVNCKIHESQIGMVRVGLPAAIRVDAYPDQVFRGEISTVSSVPMSGSWPNYDLREYALEVKLTDREEVVRQLRPGLTAQVSIIADRRDNVLQVPVQAVVKAGPETLAFRVGSDRKPVRQLIKIGGTNTAAVEVLEGLKEGDQVVLNPRTHFASEIAEVERAARGEGEGEEEVQGNTRTAPEGDAGSQSQTAPGEKSSRTAPDSGRPAGQGGGFDISAMFKRMDKDGNGSLSKAEVPSQMAARFDTMDADSDGEISKAEMSKAAANFSRGGGS